MRKHLLVHPNILHQKLIQNVVLVVLMKGMVSKQIVIVLAHAFM